MFFKDQNENILSLKTQLLETFVNFCAKKWADGTLHPLDGQAEREMRRQIYRVWGPRAVKTVFLSEYIDIVDMIFWYEKK